jgi:hypothetical protein
MAFFFCVDACDSGMESWTPIFSVKSQAIIRAAGLLYIPLGT